MLTKRVWRHTLLFKNLKIRQMLSSALSLLLLLVCREFVSRRAAFKFLIDLNLATVTLFDGFYFQFIHRNTQKRRHTHTHAFDHINLDTLTVTKVKFSYKLCKSMTNNVCVSWLVGCLAWGVIVCVKRVVRVCVCVCHRHQAHFSPPHNTKRCENE